MECTRHDGRPGSLGRVLSSDAWMTLSAVYINCEQLAARAVVEEPAATITDQDGEHVANAYNGLNRGRTYLGPLIAAPPRHRLIKRLKFRRYNRAHLAKLAAADPRLKDPAEALREHARRAANV
jgi:hypothetical protein